MREVPLGLATGLGADGGFTPEVDTLGVLIIEGELNALLVLVEALAALVAVLGLLIAL